jgi:hypothetical protein
MSNGVLVLCGCASVLIWTFWFDYGTYIPQDCGRVGLQQAVLRYRGDIGPSGAFDMPELANQAGCGAASVPFSLAVAAFASVASADSASRLMEVLKVR